MVTSALRGLFKEDARARSEFLAIIARPQGGHL
jgi:GTP cyclohydrolase I